MAEAGANTALPAPQGAPNPLQGMMRLPVVKQVGLIVALAASVALGVAVVLWSQGRDYSLLYGNLSADAATEVMQALNEAGVPYRMDERTGALMVPTQRVHEARFTLAGQGLPRSDETGFEVLKEDQGFGTSQFVERARFQRALEVELGRSISAVQAVRSARVHLAVPKQSVFVRERKPPTASVVVNLSRGGRLEEEQVAAVSHLVAAAVPDLDPADVKVVDQRGRLLTTRERSPEAALNRTQLDYVRRLESDYVDRIREILAPVVGPDGVEAQVTAEVDFTRTEETREVYNPDLPALRSEQVLEEQGSAVAAAGVPGALTNQPPGAGEAPEEAEGQGQGQGQGAGGEGAGPSRRSATRNYELDRTISHRVMPGATLRRMSVAVVVDDNRVAGADGGVQRTPLEPEEIARIEALVKEAVGFDPRRGDSVNVTNVTFTQPPPPEPVAAPPLWEQPWVWQAARQALGVLAVLFLVFGVIRPAIRRLTGAEVQAREEQARLEGQGEAQAEGGQGAQGAEGAALPRGEAGAEEEDMPMLPDAASHERRVDMARDLVNQDPKRVAQVVKSWVSQDE